MSAANHPLRGAAQVVGGLALMTAGVVGVPLAIAGGPVTFIGAQIVLWRLVWRMSRPPRAAVVVPKPWEVGS